MTFSEFCRTGEFRPGIIAAVGKVLCSTLTSAAVLLVAGAPITGPGRAQAQNATRAVNVAPRNTPPNNSDEPRYTLAFRDADIAQIADAVATATHKSPSSSIRGVRAQVTMTSSTPVNAATFYETFLSILQVHGSSPHPVRAVRSRSSRMPISGSIPAARTCRTTSVRRPMRSSRRSFPSRM